MALSRTIAVLVCAGAALLVPGAPSFAEAGGGGGGGSGGGMPSDSMPQYDPAAEYQKGAAAFTAHDYKAAATAFKHVVDAVPKHAPAQYLLGASYIGLGDYKKARKPLEAAVKLDGKLVDAQRDLAIAYGKIGDTAKAAGSRTTLAGMKSACAGTCADAARIDAALAAVDAALGGASPQALGPSRAFGTTAAIDADYVAAVGLINEGRYEPAIAALDDALWRAGPHPDLLVYLGFANRKLKRYDAARGWYEAALAIAPTHRGALEYYGELKLELGDMAGARDHLARLDRLCEFGCQQADELRRWIGESGRSAS